MKQPRPIERALAVGAGVAAAVRRRREGRRARVRVRVAGQEPRVLGEDSPAARRLLALAVELVTVYGRDGVRRRA